MTLKELDQLAKKGAPMPEGLPMHEQCYYISSRGLYAQYQAQHLTLEDAKKEKIEILKQYELGKEQWAFFLKLYEIEDKLKALKQDPFNTVVELEVHEMLETLLK